MSGRYLSSKRVGVWVWVGKWVVVGFRIGSGSWCGLGNGSWCQVGFLVVGWERNTTYKAGLSIQSRI